jgi:Arabinose-binding domain of AraC transcription regulator, N-term
MARAFCGRAAASSSIALRKQAMARSAVRASSVGGMFSFSVLNGCGDAITSRLCTVELQSSPTGHLNRGMDGVFEIVPVVSRGLVSIAEVHAIVARAHLAQSEPEMARERLGFLKRHGPSMSSRYPWSADPLLSRFAPRVGLVTLRQTFVRRSHGGGDRSCWGLKDEQSELFSPEFWTGLGFNPDGARGAFPAWLSRASKAPASPLLERVGLTPELIAQPEERLSVRSQIALLDEAAIALKDDCIGFTLARDHDPREIGLLYYVMASSQTLGEA